MHKAYHLQRVPIPEGFRIFHDRVDLPGLQHHRANVVAFCRAQNQSIEFEPDPSNVHDPNAIRLIGGWKGWLFEKRRLIGFVPRDIAAKIARSGLIAELRPRLIKTYAGTDGYAEVMFQVIGPKEKFEEYRSA